MSIYSASALHSSRSLWQETIIELRRAGAFSPALSRRPAHDPNQTFSSSVKSALSALDTFSHVLKGIDRLTHDHSERVARRAIRLARLVGVSCEEMKCLQLGALLHDCGKIDISPTTLNKPSALTDDEYSEIKQHPLHGVRILRSVPALQAAIPTVLHHHERFDGTGYPARLNGEEIPLTARIVCIVDSYDAMISERPYRRALSPQHAQETLCACSGSQFDPELVDAFVSDLKTTPRDSF